MGRGLREHSVYTPGHTQEATAKAAERVAAAATAPPDPGRRAGKSPPSIAKPPTSPERPPSTGPGPVGGHTPPHTCTPLITKLRGPGKLPEEIPATVPPFTWAGPTPPSLARSLPTSGAQKGKGRTLPWLPGAGALITWHVASDWREEGAQCAGPGGGARAPPSPEFRVPASVSPRGAAGSSLAPFLSLRRRARPSPVPLLPAPALGKGTGTL